MGQIVINFIIGGVYSLVVLSIGIWIGLLFSSDKPEKIAAKQIKRIKEIVSKPKPDGGPVKAITSQEKEEELKKPVSDRIKEIIG